MLRQSSAYDYDLKKIKFNIIIEIVSLKNAQLENDMPE